MSRIKNLFTYLIKNRRAQVDGWLVSYIKFSGEVDTIRKALQSGLQIQDKESYANTSFAASQNPWQEFAKRLIYDMNNGISSRGQSVLSWDNFTRFIQDGNFIQALVEMIKDPNRQTFTDFTNVWETTRQKLGASRNPLLVNRTLAACTTDVSSTVNGADFETVFWWLVREGLLTNPTVPNADWYDKNVQLMEYLRKEFEQEPAAERPSDQLLSVFVWELSQNIANPFSLKKQVIKYGAPGTGKTYTAIQTSELQFAIWQEKYQSLDPSLTFETCSEVVQFHPSYGYEDFIEGLRPILTTDGQSQLRLQNGIFKDFCRRAGIWETEVYRIPNVGPELSKRWLELSVGEVREYIGTHLKHCSWQSIGKLPDAEKLADITPPFFFIIDEINRAELSRVMGELMICIEYRGAERGISTQYSSLNTEETAMLTTAAGHKFFIPHNVYIIGTMNTIDRSVESFDLALRRRFRWERIDPDVTALRYHLNQRDAKPGNSSRPWAGLADNLDSLNQRIRETNILGSDYEVGHAYLMNLRYPQTLNHTEVRERVWEDSIKPLLEEYLRGSGPSGTLIPEFQKAFGIS